MPYDAHRGWLLQIMEAAAAAAASTCSLHHSNMPATIASARLPHVLLYSSGSGRGAPSTARHTHVGMRLSLGLPSGYRRLRSPWYGSAPGDDQIDVPADAAGAALLAARNVCACDRLRDKRRHGCMTQQHGTHGFKISNGAAALAQLQRREYRYMWVSFTVTWVASWVVWSTPLDNRISTWPTYLKETCQAH
jgi:hypothetical protein